MSRIVVGVFAMLQPVTTAIEALHHRGVPVDELCLLAYEPTGGTQPEDLTIHQTLHKQLHDLRSQELAATGPILTSGRLTRVLDASAPSQGASLTPGRIVAALTDQGMPEQPARDYVEYLQSRHALLMVCSGNAVAEQLVDILQRAGAVQTAVHEPQYATASDPSEPTFTAEDTERSHWQKSSKVGTAIGGVTGATVGAIFGAAGGPPGAVAGAAIGGAVGAGLGAGGDILGEAAAETDQRWSRTEAYSANPREKWTDSGRMAAEYDHRFREHYERALGPGDAAYGEYVKAYDFGYKLGLNPFYANRDWAEVAPAAERDWQADHATDWDLVAPAVRYAWQQADRDSDLEERTSPTPPA